MNSFHKLAVALFALGVPAAVFPAQAAWVSGKVLASASADGSGADAPKYSSLVLVRNSVPGEFAVQIAGPDLSDPMRIFAPAHMPAYYLTDAGSQWASGISSGQVLLSIVEAMAPLHNWGGAAYAGAVSAPVSKAQLISGMITQPDLWLNLIPQATLASADPTHIALSITSYSDLGGQLSALSVWRRPYGQNLWQWQASLANPAAATASLWDDSSVSAESLYEYAISLDFKWPGGGGAGSLSQTSGIYSTNARSISGPFAASLKQPTPTPTPAGPTASPTPFELPQGWLAYPNPVHGDVIQVAFDAQFAGNYEISAYTMAGERSLSIKGEMPKAGRVKADMGIKRLASGIYLLRIDIEAKDGTKQEMPLRKIAVLK